jgi:uncharacterized repeat protein (TIGR01451 family)
VCGFAKVFTEELLKLRHHFFMTNGIRQLPVGAALGVVLALGLHVPTAFAAEPPNPILVKNVGETEITVKTPAGTVETKRVPVEKAPPGAVVIYTTTFVNQGRKAAADIAVTNPVPVHTMYVGGSAFGDNTEITYSVDDGKTFAAPERLRIRMADGRDRPAEPADYTHVHWVYRGVLAPEKTGVVGFRVLVR